jgi:RNA polymerase-binding transcription factor DksA
VRVAARVPRQWAWHYRTLFQLRERLLRDRGEQLSEVAEPMERHSLSIADSATDEFDHTLALSSLSTEQEALFEVDEAIRRILDGSYGVCEETGKRIPAVRLRAILWTRFSREAAAQLERKGALQRARLGPVIPLQTAAAQQKDQGEEPAPADETLREIYSPSPKPPSSRPIRVAKSSRRSGR